jgi:myo-inositol-1(or 4)-monophosphatase
LKHAPYARRLTSGSSALSWCHLAAARTDLYLHSGQMAWDFAAGALILEEAGGRLATVHDDDFWSATGWCRSVIAARTPQLFHAWRDWVRANAA